MVNRQGYDVFNPIIFSRPEAKMAAYQYEYPSKETFWNEYYPKMKHLIKIEKHNDEGVTSIRTLLRNKKPDIRLATYPYSGHRLEYTHAFEDISIGTDLFRPVSDNKRDYTCEEVIALHAGLFGEAKTIGNLPFAFTDLIFIEDLDEFTYIGFRVGNYFYPTSPKKLQGSQCSSLTHDHVIRIAHEIECGRHESIPSPPEIDLNLDGVFKDNRMYFHVKRGFLQYKASSCHLKMYDGSHSTELDRISLSQDAIGYQITRCRYGFITSQVILNSQKQVVSLVNYSETEPQVKHGRFMHAPEYVTHDSPWLSCDVTYEHGYLKGPFEVSYVAYGIVRSVSGSFREEAKVGEILSAIHKRYTNKSFVGTLTLSSGNSKWVERFNTEGLRHGPQRTETLLTKKVSIVYRIDEKRFSKDQYDQFYVDLNLKLYQSSGLCQDLRSYILFLAK